MLNRLRRMLPHAAILICNMYIVFYLIDRVNPAMNFIDNSLTKGLLIALCAVSLANARALLRDARSRAGAMPWAGERTARRGGSASGAWQGGMGNANARRPSSGAARRAPDGYSGYNRAPGAGIQRRGTASTYGQRPAYGPDSGRRTTRSRFE